MSADEQDGFYTDSIPIDKANVSRQLYRTPGSNQLIQWVEFGADVPKPPAGIEKWETSREYFQGTWKDKPAFFKKTLRISKDMIKEHGFTIKMTTKVIAQNLFLCRGIPGVPELYAYSDDIVVMEFQRGITIKEAYYQGLLSMNQMDAVFPHIMGSIGLLRDRMHGHGRIFDLSFNNLLIDPLVDAGYFAWVDFDPALRGLAVLTIAEFLILLARQELIFDEFGTMKWNPEIYPDEEEGSNLEPQISSLKPRKDYYDIGDVNNDREQTKP